MPAPRIERLGPDLAGAVAEFLAARTASLPYSAGLTPKLVRERLTAHPLRAEATALVALEGSRPVGYLHGSPRPAPGGDDADLSVGVVNLLLFDEGTDEAGDALLGAALDEFRARGASSAEAMTASGGYPFFRGLFCGAEPALPADLPHVARALERSAFSVRSDLVLLSCRTGDAPPGSGPSPSDGGGLEISTAATKLAGLWQRSSWRGMTPRTASATLGGEAAGRIVFAMLPGVHSGARDAVGAVAELSVRADLRRRGIGRALIAAALGEMRSAGAAEVIVTAEADSEAALAAYSSCGFRTALAMASFRRLIL